MDKGRIKGFQCKSDPIFSRMKKPKHLIKGGGRVKISEEKNIKSCFEET